MRRKSLRTAAVAIFAVGLMAFPLGISAASADPSPASSAAKWRGAKPTIVLVHGAWADGSSFAPETTALQALGYKVLLAPNPLRSVAGDTKVLADFLAQKTTGPVVIAAHSYGGFVMTGAALSDPDVKALVYIDAFAPDSGESVQDITNAQPGSALNPDPTVVLEFVVPAPDAPQSDYDAYIKTDKFKDTFAASLPAPVANVLAAGQRPITLAAIGTPFAGEPAWKTIPSYFFIGTADKLIPPAQQEVMATRANGKIVKADAPHLAMLAQPAKVTALIVQAAKSVK